jgi:hypothetical protein
LGGRESTLPAAAGVPPAGAFGDLVNHHGFDSHLAQLQFQAEFFDSIEDGASWSVGIVPGLYGYGVFSGQAGLVNRPPV